jgi:glycosyltransferase involved in cell wall biosynthesis
MIHAHDWMTAFAAVRAREASGKPMIFHLHSLEFNRRGEEANGNIFEIERYGMERADHVIAVSAFLKNMIVSRYGIPPEKVSVAYNAADPVEAAKRAPARTMPTVDMSASSYSTVTVLPASPIISSSQ